MSEHDDVEVQFCDLCGTSVPLSDLESGVAIRHQGKTIGVCCLKVIRQGDSPLATVGVPAATPTGGASARRNENGLLLPVAIALLAGLAGVAIYLDLEIQNVADRQVRDQLANSGWMTTSAGQLESIDQAMDGAARKADIAALREQVVKLDNALEVEREQSRQQTEVFRKAIEEMRRGVKRIDENHIDYRPLFDDLRQQLLRANRAISDLREIGVAAPGMAEPVPTPASADTASDPVDTGLPPELQANVQKLADVDAAVRFEAVDLLLLSKNMDVLPHLVPVARDPDVFVRRLVVEGLRDFRSKDAVDSLIEALADEDPDVAETAWGSLKRLTGQKIPFDARAPSREVRARAQARWQDWWAKNKDMFTP